MGNVIQGPFTTSPRNGLAPPDVCDGDPLSELNAPVHVADPMLVSLEQDDSELDSALLEGLCATICAFVTMCGLSLAALAGVPYMLKEWWDSRSNA